MIKKTSEAPPSSTSLPDFVEMHRPRHPSEALAKLDPKSHDYVSQSLGVLVVVPPTLVDPATLSTPKNLFEAYLNGEPRQIVADALSRPDHYTDRQHEILAFLRGSRFAQAPTDQELNELVVTWNADTEITKLRKKIVQQMTDARHQPKDVADEAVLEDDLRGKSPMEKEEILASKDNNLFASGGFIKII